MPASFTQNRTHAEYRSPLRSASARPPSAPPSIRRARPGCGALWQHGVRCVTGCAANYGRSGVRGLDRAFEPQIQRARRTQDRRRQAVRAQLGRQPLCHPHRARLPAPRAPSPSRCQHRDVGHDPAAAWPAMSWANPPTRTCPPAMSLICRTRAGSREDDGAKGLWTRMLHPQQTFDSFIPRPQPNEFRPWRGTCLRRRPARRHCRCSTSMAASASARPIC